MQTIGRAARNVDGKVVLYADQVTGSMQRAMTETNRRREKQMAWNEANGITPESVKAQIADILDSVYEQDHVRADISGFKETGEMIGHNLAAHLEDLEKKMRDAAADLDFEEAARLRDEIKRLRETELAVMDGPPRPAGKRQGGKSPHPAPEKGQAAGAAAARRTRWTAISRNRRSTTWARAPTWRGRSVRTRHRSAWQDRHRLLRGQRVSVAAR